MLAKKKNSEQSPSTPAHWMDDEVLKVIHLQAIFKCSRTKIWRMIQQGVIPARNPILGGWRAGDIRAVIAAAVNDSTSN